MRFKSIPMGGLPRALRPLWTLLVALVLVPLPAVAAGLVDHFAADSSKDRLPLDASVLIAPTAAYATSAEVTVGPNAPIGFKLFPADNPWNTDISSRPVVSDAHEIIRATDPVDDAAGDGRAAPHLKK